MAGHEKRVCRDNERCGKPWWGEEVEDDRGTGDRGRFVVLASSCPRRRRRVSFDRHITPARPRDGRGARGGGSRWRRRRPRATAATTKTKRRRSTKHVLRDSMCQRAMADGSDGSSNHTSLPPSEFSAESAEHKSIGRPRHSNGVVCWEVETEYAPGIGLCDRIRIEFSAPGIGLCDRIRIRILAGS